MTSVSSSINIYYNILALKQEWRDTKGQIKGKPTLEAQFLEKLNHLYSKYSEIIPGDDTPWQFVHQQSAETINKLRKKILPQRSFSTVSPEQPLTTFSGSNFQGKHLAVLNRIFNFAKELNAEKDQLYVDICEANSFTNWIQNITNYVSDSKGYGVPGIAQKEVIHLVSKLNKYRSMNTTPEPISKIVSQMLKMSFDFNKPDIQNTFKNWAEFFVQHPTIQEMIFSEIETLYEAPLNRPPALGAVAFYHLSDFFPNCKFDPEKNVRAIMETIKKIKALEPNELKEKELRVLKNEQPLHIACGTFTVLKRGNYSLYKRIARFNLMPSIIGTKKISCSRLQIPQNNSSYSSNSYHLPKTRVELWERDPLETASVFANKGAMILNLGDPNAPEGSYIFSSSLNNFEHELYRRTTIAAVLDPLFIFGSKSQDFYPLSIGQEVIYSPNIFILRQSNYEFYPKPRSISVAIIPFSDPTPEKNQEIMEQTLNTFFSMAFFYKIPHLVIPDMTNHFKLLPYQTMGYAKKILKEKFHNCFEWVVFTPNPQQDSFRALTA